MRHEHQVGASALKQSGQIGAMVVIADPDPDRSESRPDHVRSGLPAEEPRLVHGRRLLTHSASFLARRTNEDEGVVEILTRRF
jgi:hypothetical protein